MNIQKIIKECVIEVLKENLVEDPKDALYVEYHSQRKGEEPFMLGDRKFEYVNGKYPDGKIDIAVYVFAGDLCYGYKAFREMMNLKEGFDPQSNAGPNPEATEGQSQDNPYAAWNNKMRQMEENHDTNSEIEAAFDKYSAEHYDWIRNKYRSLSNPKSYPTSTEILFTRLYNTYKKGITPKSRVIQVWKQIIADPLREHYHSLPENMGRYAQLAGATNLKEDETGLNRKERRGLSNKLASIDTSAGDRTASSAAMDHLKKTNPTAAYKLQAEKERQFNLAALAKK